MMMKSMALATAVVLLAAGSAVAAPTYGKSHGSFGNRGHVTAWERVQIAKSAARVASIKRRAYADGRVTRFERLRIRRASASRRPSVRDDQGRPRHTVDQDGPPH